MTFPTDRTERIAKPPRPPPVVRKEYPTVEEAVTAAEGLSQNPEEQVAIAAGLMGVPEEEVRPLVFRPKPRSTSIVTARRTIVVERRGFRSARSA